MDMFDVDYQYGIRLVHKPSLDETHLISFNARNEHDRTKFCDDLKESILEMNEMEGLRVQNEWERCRFTSSSSADHGVLSSLIDYPTGKRERPLSRTLSNSLLDMTLPAGESSSLSLSSVSDMTGRLVRRRCSSVAALPHVSMFAR
jgi:hypothetical protein